jgi:hypothetical protein
MMCQFCVAEIWVRCDEEVGVVVDAVNLREIRTYSYRLVILMMWDSGWFYRMAGIPDVKMFMFIQVSERLPR